MQSVSQLYKSKVKLIECTPQLDDFVSFQWWMILHKLLIIMCSSRKYPYLPRRRDFFLTPPHPSGNSGKSSYISLYFLIFQNPPPPTPNPPGNSNPFCGESMDIFWNCTMSAKSSPWAKGWVGWECLPRWLFFFLHIVFFTPK